MLEGGVFDAHLAHLFISGLIFLTFLARTSRSMQGQDCYDSSKASEAFLIIS
ncbi:uncharacterized protein LAESUDRAFT_553476 [Laetiporus sulphureus 93-53]|uniref:Uncharacterized protein n=1 Tax=Laetiporus sulphureus 93-53 TaxID=1314785 RepID=A0A165B8W3_9APHY|nr:uncharacterized protein LAESUDRAFT_553476 [Laetiporus sulphureus 93-53]KZT00510.1 hypothetical protein LAESUDRAFT_553476 [Laetiporus sulphureus 93-53]